MGKRKLQPEENASTSSASPPLGSITNDPAMELFLEWSRVNGAHGVDSLPQVYSTKDKMRTVITHTPIKPGSEFASIPCEMVIDEMLASRSKVGQNVVDYLKDLEQKGTEEMPNRHRILLLTFLVFERYERRNEDFKLSEHGKVSASTDSLEPSPWYPYLAILPTTYSDPLHWSKDEIDRELAGTNLYHYLTSRESDVRSELAHATKAAGNLFTNDNLSWKNWLWAYSSVYSRAFPGKWTPFNCSDNQKTFELGNPAVEPCGLALLPFLDMINHDKAAKVDWTSGTTPESTEQRVRFKHPSTSSAIEAGSEVFNNYGSKSNEEFLMGYGFVLENNEADCVRVLVNDGRASDPEFARKRILLEKLKNRDAKKAGEDVGLGDKAYGLEEGQHLFHLRRNDVPKELIELMRVLCLASWQLDEIDGGKLAEIVLSNPLSTLKAHSNLHSLLKSKLEAISKTDKKAEKFWKKERKSGRERSYEAQCASVLRRGQMDILKSCMDVCTMAIAVLSEGKDEKVHLVTIEAAMNDEAFQSAVGQVARKLGEQGEGLELDGDEILMVYLAAKFGCWLDDVVLLSLGFEEGELETKIDEILGEGSKDDLGELHERVFQVLSQANPIYFSANELGLRRTMLAAVALQRFGVDVLAEMTGGDVSEGVTGDQESLLVVVVFQ